MGDKQAREWLGILDRLAVHVLLWTKSQPVYLWHNPSLVEARANTLPPRDDIHVFPDDFVTPRGGGRRPRQRDGISFGELEVFSL